MTYHVEWVDAERMPAEHDFVLVDAGDGEVVLFMRADAVTPLLLEEAWAAYRVLAEGTPPRPRAGMLRSA